MDPKIIQDIIRLVNKSDLTEVEIEDKDFKLRIKRNADAPSTGFSGNTHVVYATSIPENASHQVTTSIPAQTQAKAIETTVHHSDVSSKAVEFRSPMIGTYYRSSSPDKPPFIQVGDVVHKGQTLCIVEAMKLFNEIEAEADGKIVKILVENAQPVEYDQVLFLIEPV